MGNSNNKVADAFNKAGDEINRIKREAEERLNVNRIRDEIDRIKREAEGGARRLGDDIKNKAEAET